jgi:hypothetical protein
MFKQSKLNTRVINSNISTIPFDEAHRIYSAAATAMEERLQLDAHLAYKAVYSERVKSALALVGTSEASFEGDLDLPFNPPELDAEVIEAEKHKAGNAALKEQFLKAYHIPSFGPKILDQLVALLSKHTLNRKGPDNTINGLEYLKDNFDRNSARDVGIYRFLMYDARGDYLPKQTQDPSKKYNALVPLILYAHKLYHDIPYSSWDSSTLHHVVNPALCRAMLDPLTGLKDGPCGADFYGLGSERAQELRTLCLKINKNNELVDRSPTTTYSLYRTADTEVADLSTLARIMVLQTWCAHTSNRTKYMVLDPKAWDTVPPPLVSQEIFNTQASTTKVPLPTLRGGGAHW